jgi:hypothetical protein
VFDVGPQFALAVRGFGGGLVLFPGEDLEDAIDQDKEQCELSAGSCDVAEGPFVGWAAGVGFGGIADVGSVGLRADLLLQFHGIELYKLEASDGPGGGDIEITNHMTGSRFILAGGVEF